MDPVEARFDKPTPSLGAAAVQNAAAIVTGRIVAIGVGGVTTLLLLRYLGSLRLGQYASLYAYLTFFSPWLTTFGMEPILVRDGSQFRARASEIVSSGVTLSLWFSITASLVAVSVSQVTGYAAGFGVLLVVAVLDQLMLTPLRLPQVVFLICLRQWYGTLALAVRQVLWFAVVVAVANFNLGLRAVIWGGLAVGILESLLILILARRLIPIHFRPNLADARRLLASSWPLGLSALCFGVLQRGDQIMLSVMVGNQELGHYFAAVKISELFGVIPLAFAATMLPIWSAVVSDRDRFQRYALTVFRYMAILASGVALAISLGANTLVPGLLGSGYAASAAALAVLIWWAVIESIRLPLNAAFTSMGLQKFQLFGTAVAAIVNISLNLLFIPRWGGVGASWATVISYSVGGWILFFLFAATRELAVLVLRASGPAIIFSVLLRVVLSGERGLRAVFIGEVVYLVGLVALRQLGGGDSRLVRQAIGGAAGRVFNRENRRGRGG